MKLRRLGDSDLQVSEISLGSWLTYSGGVGRSRPRRAPRPRSRPGSTSSTPRTSMEVGAAEEAWGEILSGHPRESYVLATKVYFPMSETDSGLSAEQIEKQLDGLARPPADRLRRPLPVPSLRRSDPDRGDDGGADRSGRARQRALHRLQRMDAGTDPRRARRAGRREVRLLPAAVQHDLACARGGGLRALPATWHLADRLVASRPGPADRQVRAGPTGAPRLSRQRRADGRPDPGLHARRAAWRRSSACGRSPIRRA